MSTPGTATPDVPARSEAEEERLDAAVPQRLLRHGGHADAVAAFDKALGEADSATEAAAVAAEHGRRLWHNAVRRLRESDGDDRPLYWTRLALSRALRRSRYGDHSAPHTTLERASRGMAEGGLPAGAGRLRVVVTGFDPFRLDGDPRHGNPSGAAALALHGTTLRTPGGHTAHCAALLFPVRWADFTAGEVERALRPHLAPGPQQAHLVVTLSQGRAGAFDLERHNGAWRGGGADNAGVRASGPVPVLGQETPPQWTRTTLPCAALTAADTGRFPVRENAEVTEVPAGSAEPVGRADGPSPGSQARAGGGGAYLSNEVAYRATLLRDTLEAELPVGHLHTPALAFPADHPERLTDPGVAADRGDVTGQVRALLAAAAAAVAPAAGATREGRGVTPGG